MQNNKLFIGNVSFDTQMQTLLDLFSVYGEITDSYKPQGKGFAFITFKTDESAAKAIEEMNGKEVDGRALVVNVARPKEDKPRTFGGPRGNGGGFQRRSGFSSDRGGFRR